MSGGAGLARAGAACAVLALALVASIVASPIASAQTTINQGPPFQGSTDVAGSATYTDTLTAASGFTGTVTFATLTPGFTINGTDQLATTGTLSALDSPYTVTGSDSDGSGDSGNWTYVLTVASDTITQTPASGSTDVVGSAAFSDTLVANSGFVGAVTFTTSTPGFEIVNGDELETTGTLSSLDSPYSITGNDSDAYGDTGMWTYSLTVAPDTITQTPASGSTDVAGSAAFSDTLVANSGFVGPVTFTTSTPGFAINGDANLVTSGTLSATGSPYSISGSDSDAYGDTGMWSYSLTVAPDTIVQASPTSGSTTTTSSSEFSTTLSAASGFVGSVTFVTSTPDFTISNGDELKTTTSLIVSGSPYVVTGTDSDADGDSGHWTYTLTVVATGGGGGGGGGGVSINQTSATTGTVVTTSSATYTAGPIAVEGNTGPVTFVTTHSNPSLTVSSSGVISTTGTLLVGTYSVSGTDSDAYNDTGTWSFTLTVTAAAVMVTVTFEANGGTGTMTAESASGPTALSLNAFARKGYTFVDWNTAANGSGTSYANGASFPFSTTTTLFAQWKRGKIPTRTITFIANRGAGTTPSEVENTPTSIKASRFHRSGYTFVDWNTSAKGSGEVFKAGATYSFKKSITLYAQWKKVVKVKAPPKSPPSHAVNFAANGGAGTMAAESHRGPATLASNHFRRAGYTFLRWNTSPNGKGVSYANRATYSFTASTTLYAQWKKNKVATPPPPTTTIPGGVTIGPFAVGSSSLSSALKSQVQSLAAVIKTDGDQQITLYGFGDKTTTSSETSVALGRQRASAVATYLEAQLAAIGLKGWTISIEPATANKLEFATVIATLS